MSLWCWLNRVVLAFENMDYFVKCVCLYVYFFLSATFNTSLFHLVTCLFHFYSRSSYHFSLCFIPSRVDELNKLAGLQCMRLHSSAGRALKCKHRDRGFESCWCPEKTFFRLLLNCLNSTAMVTYSFHLCFRSSHHFVLRITFSALVWSMQIMACVLIISFIGFCKLGDIAYVIPNVLLFESVILTFLFSLPT